MRAVTIREHGDVDTLQIGEAPPPPKTDGPALIEVRACALNHLDLWVRKGVPGHAYPLPLIPGCDVSGVVVEAPGWSAGDEVVLQPGVSCGQCAACLAGDDPMCRQYGILGESRDGGCATHVRVPAANLLPKPPNLSFEEAAAYPLVFLTAWHMLVARARVRPGEVVLVHAAGSGVSSAAIQIARLLGARVFATAGTEVKRQRGRALGAEEVFDYRADPPWSRAVRKAAGAPVDVVVDHVGVATFEDSLKCLRRGGRYVTCGATTGGDASLNLHRLFFKSLSLLGSTMGSKGELHEITRLIARGALRPIVDRVLPLEEIRDAHRVLEAREAFGKVVVRP